MKILLFGGTTEGRILAEELTRRGHQVTVSVATALGAEELSGISCTVWQGRMDEQEMAMRVRAFDLVMDATHPYAEVVSRYIRAACEETGIPLRRVLREASVNMNSGKDAPDTGASTAAVPGTADTAPGIDVAADAGANAVVACADSSIHSDLIRVDSCRAAAEYLQEHTGNVLVATGSKALRDYACLVPERIYPRVLPTHEALHICEEMGIPHKNILALQGPFTLEMNVAMLRQYDISWLVTKDGGKVGGFNEKWQAAQQTGVRLILVRRPADQGESMEQLLLELESRV